MPSRPGRHKNTSVTVAYVRPAQVSGKFTDSLAGLILFDSGNQQYLSTPGGHIGMQSSPRIAEARSQVVDEFLRPGSPVGAEWLFWLDADATFDSDVLARLMDHADARTAPILGALAFGGSSPENMFPTVYTLEPPKDGQAGWDMNRKLDYPRDALVKVGATGCHCVLVHRQVFVAMANRLGVRPDGSKNPYPWYMEGGVSRTGAPIGEDVGFCINAQCLGIPVHIHTGIRTGHVKETVLDEAMWDRQQEHAAPEYREFKIA